MPLEKSLLKVSTNSKATHTYKDNYNYKCNLQ